MRKSLWITLAVMVVAIAAPIANADSFTPTFTTNGCSGTCFLLTAPDVTFPSPTTIDVTFAGPTMSVAIPSGDAPGDTYIWFAASNGFGGFADLLILDLNTNPGVGPFPCTGGLISCGTLSFAAVTTPEPSSVALMPLGVGFVFVLRKRNSRGHQLAA